MDTGIIGKMLSVGPKMAKKFVPYSHYGSKTDTLTVFVGPDPDYSMPVDSTLTVFLSLKTDQIVGYQISGAKSLGVPGT